MSASLQSTVAFVGSRKLVGQKWVTIDETVRKGKRLNVMTRSVNSFDNGRYRQTGIIHDGLYSDIFEVYDNDTGQRQALKVLKLINGDLATQRALFDKEVISLTRLRHPAVVQLKNI